MDLFRRSRFLAAAVTSALLLSVVALATAQSTASQQDPDAEFRAALSGFYDEAEHVSATLALIGGPKDLAQKAAEGRRGVPSLTAEELALMRSSYQSSFWDAWKALGPAVTSSARYRTRPLRIANGLFAAPACPPDIDRKALLDAQIAEIASETAYNLSAAAEVPGVSAPAATALGISKGVQLALAQDQYKHDTCVSDAMEAAIFDNVDEKVSTRASQTSVDDLKNLITGMLDDLKRHIDQRASELTNVVNSRANEIVALIRLRADQIEALVNRRADGIEALVKARANYIDDYQKNVVAHQQLDLQVVEVERGRLILMSGEAGTPFSVLLTSVQVAEAKPNSPLAFREVVSTTQSKAIAPGVMEITLDMRGPAKDATVYLINVAHTHTTQLLGTVTHTGTTIVRRNAP